mmetsp:Transcript_30751/g.42073  ORF Transcript_30751/g.42073 Transcript_30751/m.42073 type:complete len:224 (-) Transcript_30751:811-1482(-)
MRSASVTNSFPSGPQQTPFRAKFFMNSQPRAPQPTMKYLKSPNCCTNCQPYTAANSSCGESLGATSFTSVPSSSSGRASMAAKWKKPGIGVNLPVTLTTSCASTPPTKAAMACNSTAACKAYFCTNASSTSRPSTSTSLLANKSFAICTTAAASCLLLAAGSLFLLDSANFKVAKKARCCWYSEKVSKSVLTNCPGFFSSSASDFIGYEIGTFFSVITPPNRY